MKTFEEKRQAIRAIREFKPGMEHIKTDDWAMCLTLVLAFIGGWTVFFGLIWLVMKATYGF